MLKDYINNFKKKITEFGKDEKIDNCMFQNSYQYVFVGQNCSCIDTVLLNKIDNCVLFIHLKKHSINFPIKKK